MDQQQDSPLFGLSVDPVSKSHLAEAARWAKFLAIVGFIMCGLVVLVGIFAGSFFSMFSSRYSSYDNDVAFSSGGVGIFMAVLYIGIAILYFFPCLFLYQFAAKMKVALQSDDQDTLNVSFQSLKKMFRFVGILTIIFLSFYAIALIIGLIGAAARM
ncbi:MAG: DUF5362 family protein [Chitinophagaceae bacterium]